MKKILNLIIPVIAICFANGTQSQNLNWGNVTPENKHHFNVHVGLNNGLVFGIGYGYQLNTIFPTVLNIEISAPAGKNLLDDFKVKIGGQIKVYELEDFCFSVNAHGVFRRYENDLVRMVNFGSDFSGVIGYYQPKWFIAGSAGFDKAIVTHFKHSDLYKEYYYDEVTDGWYEPATGGHFYYGLQTGYSLKNSDITLAIGKVIEQDFKTEPLLPFYASLGFNMRINESKRD